MCIFLLLVRVFWLLCVFYLVGWEVGLEELRIDGKIVLIFIYIYIYIYIKETRFKFGSRSGPRLASVDTTMDLLVL